MTNEPLHPKRSSEQTVGPIARGMNIACRTAHIGVTGLLFGGHAFGIDRARLLIWLYLTVGTGICLILLEAYPSWRWCYQGRGALVLSKILLLCLIPWFWNARVYLLVAIIILGAVGSHMPRQFRYYSILHRRIIKH